MAIKKKNQETLKVVAKGPFRFEKVGKVEATPIDFETWYFKNAKKIPSQHAMEIIWADFEARGLKKLELEEVFVEALKKYGINIAN